MEIGVIEKSKSNKARCNYCGKVLQLGEKRLVWEGHHYNHSTKVYTCIPCSLLLIEKEIERLNQKIKQLKGELPL